MVLYERLGPYFELAVNRDNINFNDTGNYTFSVTAGDNLAPANRTVTLTLSLTVINKNPEFTSLPNLSLHITIDYNLDVSRPFIYESPAATDLEGDNITMSF